MENINKEIKKLNLMKTKIDTKSIFKMVQKIANELTNGYQIALFEDNEKKMEEIETFLNDIVPSVKWGEQIIPFTVLYQWQTPLFKQMLCSYLYYPKMKIRPTNKVSEFIKEYVDIDEYYAELVLISLFYL